MDYAELLDTKSEEYFGDENADKIPTSKLKESNYKDLRVLQDFFEENHYA